MIFSNKVLPKRLTSTQLKKVKSDIKKIDAKIEHKQQKADECKGIRYRKFHITLIKEIGELLVQRSAKQEELSKIVTAAGYKDVSKFMKAFEKSCRLLEEYKVAYPEKFTEGSEQGKESVRAKLKAYEEEAKSQSRKNTAKKHSKER